MFFIILGNLEPRPLACAAQGCPVSCPGRGQPWKYLRQRTRPRVTARRCPMRRTPSRRRQFEETVGRSAQPWTGGRLYTIKTADFARCRRTCRAPANHCCALDDVKN